MSRVGECKRKTEETSVRVKLDLDGSGTAMIQTGIPFFDHMLELVSRHSLIDIELSAIGDLEVDAHHTVEDTGIAIGEALKAALGDAQGIRRFGSSLVPMDESLAEVAIDISGRPHLSYNVELEREPADGFDPALMKDFFQSLANRAMITLHVNLRFSGSVHHGIEAVVKAFARALKEAVEIDPRVKGVPSTKGKI